jgi:hypothetical protein
MDIQNSGIRFKLCRVAKGRVVTTGDRDLSLSLEPFPDISGCQSSAIYLHNTLDEIAGSPLIIRDHHRPSLASHVSPVRLLGRYIFLHVG